MSATDANPAPLQDDAAESPMVDVAALYQRHGNWLVAFLRRRFSPEEAEDLAQETYVQTVGTRTEIRNPRAFLARVALRTAREISERKANRMVYWPEQAADFALAPEQEDSLVLKQAIQNLPSELQVVFVLSRFAGLTNIEIAQRCGISVKRVEARMTKARAQFAALMRD